MAELVSTRYADALFQVAHQEQSHETVQAELNFLHHALKAEPQFSQLLKSPLISSEEKKTIVSAIFENKISQMVLNFLYILIDKRRAAFLEGIIREYNQLINGLLNQVEGIAYTAVPLSQKQLISIQEKLSLSSKKKVSLSNQVDPSLLGGVLIHMGDQILDGTIKRRLEQLGEALSQNIV